MNVQTRNASITAASDGVFIDNEWRPSASGAVLDVIDPASGEVFTQIAAGNAQDIDAAVQAARRALSSDWGRMAAADRGRILTRAAALVTAAFDELAELEARDCGKPISQARADITATARYLEFYGGAADKVHGDMIPFMPGYFVTTEHVPHGVTGHIIPWNYPAQMFGRTISAALAMGNACVLKPAEDACLTPLRLCEILREAGLPAGALNCVPGRGKRPGPRCRHIAMSISSASRAARLSGSRCRNWRRGTISAARWNWGASRRRLCSKTRIWMSSCRSS